MKLDRIKFARLIGAITNIANRTMSVDEIDCIDYLTEINVEPVSVPYADAAIVNDLLKAMKDGQKIAAIKAYRSLTGLGLKESKDAVEKHWSTEIKRTRQELYKVLNSEVISPEKDDIISSFINRAY